MATTGGPRGGGVGPEPPGPFQFAETRTSWVGVEDGLMIETGVGPCWLPSVPDDDVVVVVVVVPDPLPVPVVVVVPLAAVVPVVVDSSLDDSSSSEDEELTSFTSTAAAFAGGAAVVAAAPDCRPCKGDAPEELTRVIVGPVATFDAGWLEAALAAGGGEGDIDITADLLTDFSGAEATGGFVEPVPVDVVAAVPDELVVVPLPEPVVPEALDAVWVTFDFVPLSSPEEEEDEDDSSSSEDDELTSSSSFAACFGFDIF